MGCGASKPSGKVAPAGVDAPEPSEAFLDSIDKLSVGPVMCRVRVRADLSRGAAGPAGAGPIANLSCERVLGGAVPGVNLPSEGRTYLVRAFDVTTSIERVVLVHVPDPLPSSDLSSHHAQFSRDYSSVVSLAGRLPPSVLGRDAETKLTETLCSQMIAWSGHEETEGENKWYAVPAGAQRGGLSLHVYSGSLAEEENPLEQSRASSSGRGDDDDDDDDGAAASGGSGKVKVKATRRTSVTGEALAEVSDTFLKVVEDISSTVMVRNNRNMGTKYGRMTVSAGRATGKVDLHSEELPFAITVPASGEWRTFVVRALNTGTMEDMAIVIAVGKQEDGKEQPSSAVYVASNLVEKSDSEICEALASTLVIPRPGILLESAPHFAWGGLIVKAEGAEESGEGEG